MTLWTQSVIEIPAQARGFHLITEFIEDRVEGIERCEAGLLHLFIQHTSASLAINENADSDVRGDLQRHFDVLAPRNAPYYRHVLEGDDDMPAHIKSVLIGTDLTIPIRHGELALGIWQGIYLAEHRDHAGPRSIVATLQGTERI
ncbi:secondary thiamine-phosphate synthase enzyme YjbQ [Congregibacter sp.]|jgi:secondary thiamine-phosphate synthase enzyme|uniref:secondary thiamine-phosphate synthase enzyme YjbQ n=1 Tax=Congregibacter sp. TaxID=2744308 RepID=UPI0039E43777